MTAPAIVAAALNARRTRAGVFGYTVKATKILKAFYGQRIKKRPTDKNIFRISG
jgi:hypothetical protein